MRRLLFISFVAAVVLIACKGSGDGVTGDGVTNDDREQIEELSDLVGMAAAAEDWPAIYDLYPPSLRESCPEDEYIDSVTAAADYARASVGDEAWEAALKVGADGYDLKSIEVDGDEAIARAEEGDEPLFFRHEDGRWWYYQNDPCGFEAPGEPATPPSPAPTSPATPQP